jgi:hypothetical protein
MMRVGKLAVALVMVAGGCESFGTERAPLGAVDREPDAGAGSAGAAGAIGGGTGGATQQPGDAGTPCWESQLPPAAQPILPVSTVAASCQAAATVTDWSWPDGSGNTTDDRGRVVGRWATCGTSGITSVPHAGIEFGANGRWRFLAADANGNLVPMAATVTGASGNYYLLASGQLDLNGEDPASGYGIFFATLSGGDALRLAMSGFNPTTGAFFYARTTPSPLDGTDNPPPLTDGACTMVGTWDLPAYPGATAATFSFDGAGNFVGGPSDLCSSHTMYGTYSLSPQWFQITTGIGMGPCQWWYWAAWPATFDATCTHVTLVQHYDNCTGGRGYWEGTTTMTRRP